MKILETKQIRKADEYTIVNEPIASIDLMERAAKAFFDAIRKYIKKQDTIKVICGMGNNGGDGLAVSRMLLHAGYKVETWKIIHSSGSSVDFEINEKRLRKLKKASILEITEGQNIPNIEPNHIVIDAIFGSGLTRPLDGFPAKITRYINSSGAKIFAIDVPTGLFAENNSQNQSDAIIRAAKTFTFQLPKLAFMFPDNYSFTGDWEVLDIGLNQEFIAQEDTPWHYLIDHDLKPHYRYRNKFDHKGMYGHGLLIAGSSGKSGAALLASRAALLMGMGLLTTHVPKHNYQIQQSGLPEGMVSIDEDHHYFTGLKETSAYKAIAIGPGLGQEKQTQNALKLLIQNTSTPMIFDADAINILAENPTWLSFIPPGSILTPHVGEFERLTGKCTDGWERLHKAREMAFRYRCYIVLKGAHTAIVSPDKQCIFNSTGNPGLAKGGSGDVLTGVLLGLLSQGYSSLFSSTCGVFIHGMAADLAARKKPIESMLAGDIIYHIPKALSKVFF